MGIRDVRYISTRGTAPTLGFEDVLLAGLARDGGLYVPETWPQLSPATLAGLAGRPFHEAAVEIIAPFTGDAISTSDLTAMAKAAYAGFGHPATTPLVQIGPSQFVLELFHGPTLAFKDVAMQLLARMMDHVLEKRGQRATIVGATSGDTGGAAIEAFRGSRRVDVVILFPDGRVSDVQRRMMTTPTETNVKAVAIDGTFDDCQALVKAMFNDHVFRDRVGLSGINSINWGRILAQITYYAVAAAALGATENRPVSFIVPTGNFGDIFAGYAARRMGVPIGRLVIASNANDILPRTLETGAYEMRPVAVTSAPSMDIVISSNFERYLFEASGRDAAYVRTAMANLTQSRRFDLGPVHRTMLADFGAVRASEADIASATRRLLDEAGYLVCPHTACAFGQPAQAGDQQRSATDGLEVILATAAPAKFPEALEATTGHRPGLPPRLSRLMTDPERFDVLPNDLAAVERYVEDHALVGQPDVVASANDASAAKAGAA